jgi:hypothetical protein
VAASSAELVRQVQQGRLEMALNFFAPGGCAEAIHPASPWSARQSQAAGTRRKGNDPEQVVGAAGGNAGKP